MSVGPLIGRAKELQEGREVLRSAREQHVARLLRISGTSGIGKTALANELVEEARRDGWITATIQAHRIQAAISLESARRLVEALTQTLAATAELYLSGLKRDLDESPADGGAVEETLLRLLEAILIDRPVLLFIDDAQWADAESRSLVMRILEALADRPLTLVSTERIDEQPHQVFDFSDATIVVPELDRGASTELAQTLLPQASREVIEAIAEHARGRALDIIALSRTPENAATTTLDDLAATLRTLIARDLALMDAGSREFLQIVSLIPEPIRYDLLRVLFPDERRLLADIQRFSVRYLVQRGDAVHFVHAAIAQSVRETIAIEIPYRRRVFDALQILPQKRLEDYERAVEQAHAIGDRVLERAQLEVLIEHATAQRAIAASAGAIERLLPLVLNDVDASLALYSRLSIQYNALSRDGDTHRVCTEALDYAISRDVRSGLGQLVLSDLFALFFRGETEAFDRTLMRFEAYFEAPEDRGYLAIGKLFRAMSAFDANGVDAALAEFDALHVQDRAQQVRIDAFNGFHVARCGDIKSALDIYAAAKSTAQSVRPILGVMIVAGELMLKFQAFGALHPQTLVALEANRYDPPTHAYFMALQLLAEGQFRETIGAVSESLVHARGTYVRRHLLGIAAMASLLAEEALAPAMRAAIEAEVLLTPRSEIVGAQLPAALFTAVNGTDSMAKDLLDAVFSFACRQPNEPMALFIPSTLVAAAQHLKRADILDAIASGALAHDRLAFNEAQYELAKLRARKLVGGNVEADVSTKLAERLDRLGAPYFAALARDLSQETPMKRERGDGLSRREREVTTLVADGLTNREIASRLVLSERTVEAHIANIFAKVGVASRAQLAVWYARSSSLAAT